MHWQRNVCRDATARTDHGLRRPLAPYLGLSRLPIALLLLLLVLLPGCVRRRMTIRSEPSGALVSIDQQEIGTTPVSVGYTYYGTRNFQVTRDGYETASVSRTFKPPWYQWPIIDFFAENLWPFEVRDERVVDFSLIPQKPVATAKLVQRAGELRSGAQSGIVTPLVQPDELQPANPLFMPATPGGFAPPPPAVITPPN